MTEREDYMLDVLRAQRQRHEQEDRKLSKEEQLRRDNPGLQELWDQYQTMLKLVTPPEEPKKEETVDEILAQLRNKAKMAAKIEMANPCDEVYMPDQPPKEKGKVELNGKRISMETLMDLFNGKEK